MSFVHIGLRHLQWILVRYSYFWFEPEDELEEFLVSEDAAGLLSEDESEPDFLSLEPPFAASEPPSDLPEPLLFGSPLRA
jgi:hypothetical protein